MPLSKLFSIPYHTISLNPIKSLESLSLTLKTEQRQQLKPLRLTPLSKSLSSRVMVTLLKPNQAMDGLPEAARKFRRG
jgi:hypothetical protein